jgi:antibiotic biosynthesis monooxygenase (ABM) superfamily enzyme
MDNLPKWKMKDFQSDEKYEGFSKWFYCNGQPVQEEKAKIFQNGKNCEDFSKW